MNTYFVNKMRGKKAFSLLELAIVIAISSILMVGLIDFLNSMSSITKEKANKSRVENLKNAINDFFAVNNRLPCPANPTLATTDANYGVESLNTDGICDYNLTYNGTQSSAGFRNHRLTYRTGTSSFLASIYHRIIFGAIPYKTLGLSESTMYDEYSNKITYITGAGYATKRSSAPSTSIYSRINGWARVAIPARFYAVNDTFANTYPCSTSMFRDDLSASVKNAYNMKLCLELNAPVTCYGNDSNPVIFNTLIAHGWLPITSGTSSGMMYAGDAIVNNCGLNISDYNYNLIASDNVAYALISHGRNGFGAWNKSGTLNSQPTSFREQKNTFGYYKTKYDNSETVNPVYDVIGSQPADSTKYLAWITGAYERKFYGLDLTVQDNAYKDFDDDVLFQTTSDILGSRKNSVYCHQSTLRFDVPPGSSPGGNAEVQCHLWQPTPPSTTAIETWEFIDSGNSVNPKLPLSPSCNTSNDTPMRIDCTAGGIWANPQ